MAASRLTVRWWGAVMLAFALLISLLISLIIVAGHGRAQGADTLTIWISPTGSDDNDGLTANAPFKTLQHASDWLCGGGSGCPGRGEPVVVRLAQTTWGDAVTAATAKTVTLNPGDSPAVQALTATAWNYFDPSFTTTFEPWNYQIGDNWAKVSASGGYPTFDGGFGSDAGFVFTPLTATPSGRTGLTFLYIRWEHYRRSAVTLSGGLKTTKSNGLTVYSPTDLTAGGVIFYGDYFFQVGNWFRPQNDYGYGAILANNSPGNVVRNNHFVQLKNRLTDQDSIHVHGLYISHWSNRNLVEGNEFTDVTGDPIRQRDHSYSTTVQGNTFTRAGAYGYMDDYYCRPNTASSYCTPKEYRSFGGVFTGNTMVSLYAQGLSGRRTVFCHDIPTGLCPTNRITVTT